MAFDWNKFIHPFPPTPPEPPKLDVPDEIKQIMEHFKEVTPYQYQYQAPTLPTPRTYGEYHMWRTLEECIQFRNETILSGWWVTPMLGNKEVGAATHVTPEWDVERQEFLVRFEYEGGATIDVDGVGIRAHRDDPAPFCRSKVSQLTGILISIEIKLNLGVRIT